MGVGSVAVPKEDKEAKTGAEIQKNLGSAGLGVRTQGGKDN